ncbi:hypothetical protein G6F70_008851 [Rhizopus microsporus]|uniref:Uncharacterized protein n=1 Tax=Rhizopus azygosporus TaxID=86630 RepID=A0A367JJ22_RHIAZ|nr:hypothetical protein G6F71_008811 [Rhizopus microsporus]RCH89869.1 hypothetical protein CU097_007292 [Rhizopus azygosporus]KAG1194408.1 hypothetical protein G6F70_008851 [Rhizopus microsporus]KAG1206437.1 hypothetical protein G6F69_008833 [Rhizopus microsporus]KAG1226845.1 hypothetical protein G6F67_008784 [Rhizopus microsporus]
MANLQSEIKATSGSSLMSKFTDESFNALRQQLTEAQAIVQQLVQERQVSPSEIDNSSHFSLHDFGAHPYYGWTLVLLVKDYFSLE